MKNFFEKEEIRIVEKYNITKEHAGCYLCNGGRDEYICKIHNGGCEHLQVCKDIYKNEQRK